MPISPGTRLGSYEILSPIGAGGMGEVYRAKDTKLNRDVAIKVLPEAFALDADRLARFTREAQVLASLNHPNIAAIYGIEANAIVMELVEGEDLSEVIARGAMPMADALPIARQIADALEAAHELGIVHRDLKPQNIKVRADGTVKVLDFGLAKAIDPAASASGAMNSPTMTARATQMGMVIGTAAYMAPEQAKGRAVDKRADIWAFGVVLYEMLTGARAFKGDDVTETLASVLKDSVEFNALPPSVPPRMRSLIERCVERDVKLRLRDIGEARVELAKIADGRGDLSSSPAVVAAKPQRASALPWTVVAIATLALGSAFVWAMFFRAAPAAATPAMRLTIPFGKSPGLHTIFAPSLAISRDGGTIVYNGNLQTPSLFVRRVDQPEPALIRGAVGLEPFLSPDGTNVGFIGLDGMLKIVSIDGGAPVNIAAIGDLRGASWGDDGFIVYAPSSEDALWRIKASAGATPEKITTLDVAAQEKTHRLPDVLPDGKGVLFVIGNNKSDTWDDAEIAVLAPGVGTPKILVRGGTTPRYSAGHLLYFHGEDLLCAPFDLDRLELTGPAVSIASDVAFSALYATADFAVSPSALVYYPGKEVPSYRSVIETDRAGKVRKITGGKPFYAVRWLPDQTRMLATIDAGNASVWMLDTRRDSSTRLTYGTDTGGAMWDRAANAMVYGAIGGLFVGGANGGPGKLLYDAKAVITGFDISPDGQFIALATLPRPTGHIWMYSKATGQATMWSPPQVSEGGPRFSPDGQWLIYSSIEGTESQVFVKPAHGTAAEKIQVSASSAGSPLWSSNGREVFFLDQKDMWVADVRPAGKTLEIGTPRRLFALPLNAQVMDIAPDGNHFLFLQDEPNPLPPSITYFSGWLDALKKKGSR